MLVGAVACGLSYATIPLGKRDLLTRTERVCSGLQKEPSRSDILNRQREANI